MDGSYYSILILSVLQLTCMTQAIDFTHHMLLDPDGDYEMKWAFDNDTITVKVEVKTTGWIGWGLSENGKMKGADMVIGWIDDHGKKHFSDRHALGHHEPYIDDRQDYKLNDMFEESGYTTIIFNRKIKLCSEQDFLINSDTMRVLYAWNNEDPYQNKYISMHSKKGSRSVYLLDYGYNAKQDLPTKYKSVDFVMNNLTLPDWDTAYYCKGFILPNMTGKHHLIRVDPVITPGNEDYVHHMLLYQCESVTGEGVNNAHHCYGKNMPGIECGRDNVVHGWAIGGTTYYYPKDVGLSLNDNGDPKYFLLEVHYDNRLREKDIVDNSGVRLIYTDQLRKYDASVLATGVAPDGNGNTQIIPQKLKNFTSFGYCNSKCLDVKSEKRYIFTAGLHTHLYGRKIVVRLVRDSDGVEVKRIAEDLNYDFNFQESRMLREPVEILPDHSIHVECTYNTELRDSPVLSGLGTKEEMCLAYLFIYPKLNTRLCYSRSAGFYTWGRDKLGWKVGQSGELLSSVILNGTDYKSLDANVPLKQKEFWMKYPNMEEDFEKSLKKDPYWKICRFADNRRGNYYDLDRSELREKVPDPICVEDNGPAGSRSIQMKATYWAILLTLYVAYLTR